MLFLAQTDTTVGFISHSAETINKAKQRSLSQKVLQTFPSFKALNKITRVPKKHRSFVRRSKKTTFVLDNGLAFRVVSKESLHHSLIESMGAVFSSSANMTKKSFNENDACLQSDIIVKDRRGFYEAEASEMFKLSRSHKKRLR